MTEQNLVDAMADAVRDEPPMGFDPDEVIDRAGRRQVRRRSVAAAAAATAVVAASAGVFAATHRSPTSDLATPPPTSTVRVTPAPTRVPPSQVLRHLQTLGLGVLADHVPGTKFTLPDGYWFGMNEDLSFDPKRPSAEGVYAAAGTPHRGITLDVWHRKNAIDLGYDPMQGTESPISQTTGPDGTVLKVFRYSIEVQDGYYHYLAVEQYRRDGVVTGATAYDKLPTKQATPHFPATQAQLTALAQDPRLSF